MGVLLFLLMLLSPWMFGLYGTIICAALWLGYLIMHLIMTTNPRPTP